MDGNGFVIHYTQPGMTAACRAHGPCALISHTIRQYPAGPFNPVAARYYTEGDNS